MRVSAENYYHMENNANSGRMEVPLKAKLLKMFDTLSHTEIGSTDTTIVGIFEYKSILDFYKFEPNLESETPVLERSQLLEYKERSSRKNTEGDDITKIRSVGLRGGNNITVCLRQSGNLDFYWNYELVYSSDLDAANKSLLCRFTDFAVSFDHILITKVTKI
jgi:hypothetical protein